MRKMGAKMGVEITSTSNLVKAIKAGRNCVSVVGGGAGRER